MFDDVVTLFTHAGEAADGQAQYKKTVLRRALVRLTDGMKQYPARNVEGEDRATVYFWVGRRGSDPEFVDEAAYDAAQADAGQFTIRTDGLDRLFYGETAGDRPPQGKGTYRPVSVTVNRKGSAYVQHVKVVCR